MATILNERDQLLQATVPRYSTPIDRALMLSASATTFEVSLAGVAAPGAIAFTALMLGATGKIAFSAEPATPLAVANDVATLAFADMAASVVTVTASTVIDGVTYLARQTVNKTQALDLAPPPAPTGLLTSGRPAAIELAWDAAPANYHNLSHTEVWRATVNDFAHAALAGRADGRVYTDPVGPGAFRYYWIRHVSRADIPGPYNASFGTGGASDAEVEHLLQVLTHQITEGQLYAALGAKIDLIGTLDGKVGDLQQVYGDTVAAATSAGTAARAAANAIQAAAEAALAKAAADLAAGGAGQYATDAHQSATSADTAAANASTLEKQSSQSASNAKGSAGAAASAASTAAGAAGAAGESAGAASTSKDLAAGSVSAAGVAATASNEARLAAQAARDAAGGSADAALQYYRSASAAATSAGDSASAASLSEIAATTRAGLASISASNAATSASDASGSASQASASEQLAAASRDAAGGWAHAAAGSAGTADTKSTEASQFAQAASVSLLSANAAAGVAGGAATQAGSSAAAALQSAQRASGSADAAGGSASAARSERIAAEAAYGLSNGSAQAALVSAQNAEARASDAGQSAKSAIEALANAKTAAGDADSYLKQAAHSATQADGSVQAAADFLHQAQAMLKDPITGLQGAYAAVKAQGDASVTSLGKVQAKWAVNVDANGVAGGFGIIGSADGLSGTVDFAVRANKFYIAAPEGSGVAASVPFIVQATPTQMNGVTVPPGVYVTDAFIQNGTITNAKIGGDIWSGNYAAGQAGWYLNRSGAMEINSLRARGHIAGAAYASFDWPAAGGNGFYLGPEGLRLGNYHDGKYLQVEANGNISAPGFSITNGNATFSGTLQAADGNFSGVLKATSGTLGVITAGRLQNPGNSAYINLNAGGAEPFLYAGAGAIQLNANGGGYFARSIVSAPKVEATGIVNLAGARVGFVGGESVPLEVYIDTGVNFEAGWNSVESATFLANATISGGQSLNGGCNGYTSATVVVGDGLIGGGQVAPFDSRIYIRFYWTPAGGNGSIVPSTITWKLVKV